MFAKSTPRFYTLQTDGVHGVKMFLLFFFNIKNSYQNKNNAIQSDASR